MKRSTPAFPWRSLLAGLRAQYHLGPWRVPYLRDHAEDPFQVLAGTILSQRTRDANTDRASALLFAAYPDASSLAAAPLPKIERLVHATGFYRTKARHLRETARAIRDRFGGKVPRSLPELLSLPGVGRKTANCVIVFGFGEPAIPVDTHVHRISNRLGAIRTRTPEETEHALESLVPRDLWVPLNPVLVQHGQNICRPRNPLCERCRVLALCATGKARRDGTATPLKGDRIRPAVGTRPRGRILRRAARGA